MGKNLNHHNHDPYTTGSWWQGPRNPLTIALAIFLCYFITLLLALIALSAMSAFEWYFIY